MFNQMIEVLKANPRKIVFTEGHDARILEATARLKEGGFLTPVLIGNVDEVKANAAKGGFDIEMLRAVSDVVSVPVIASGGAGCIDHFTELLHSEIHRIMNVAHELCHLSLHRVGFVS